MPSWPSSPDSDFPSHYVPTESEHTDEDWNINYQEQHYEDVAREYPNIDILTLQPSFGDGIEQSIQQQLVHLQEPEVDQVPILQPTVEQEVNSYPVLCHCGYMVEVVVRADGENCNNPPFGQIVMG